MCEESTCLVPPLDTPPSRPTENRRMLLQLPTFCMPTSFSPTIDSRIGSQKGGGVLVGFHEDALSQATVGKAQIILTCALGLGLAADCSELTTLDYILPAAELQLCIGDQKKRWLVFITLLGMAIGSLAWGILGDQIGRRRALISALSVAALFSVVASVMPTYGTFMTARFCSGLGVSGAFPLSFSYLMETCSRKTRARYSGFLHAFWPLGAAFISLISYLIMPTLGEDIVEDNREHWNSWHKFLILSTLPTVGSIIGLIWASESPRFLLEASREVEALAVYQRLHRLNNSRTQYGLTEMELPGACSDRLVSPTKNSRNNGLASFREVLRFVTFPSHFRHTLLLACLHFHLGFLYMGVSTFSKTIIKELRDDEYFSQRQYVANRSFSGIVFNGNIENVQYGNTSFRNSTFSHMSLNHVEFVNCSVEESKFISVKASVSYFKDSFIKDSRFIDTDLTTYHFVNCTLINNTFLSVTSNCTLNFDYNVYVEDLHQETLSWSLLTALSLAIVGFSLDTGSRRGLTIAIYLMVGLASSGIFFASYLHVIEFISTVIRLMLICAVNIIIVVVVEEYPCHLRCTAHGMMRSMFHIGSFCGINTYDMMAHRLVLFPAVITIALSFYGALLSKGIQDNGKVLL